MLDSFVGARRAESGLVSPKMSGPVEEFFQAPIPEEVWHYTTFAGFNGILSSGTVWATEAHHTTDKSEFIHDRVVAEKYVANLELNDADSRWAKDVASGIVRAAFDEGALSPESTEVFVASFSSAKDLKSQWMEYADGGRGISLSFDLRNVRPPQHFGFAITFAPCIYQNDEKERLIDAALSHIIKTTLDLGKKTRDLSWVDERIRDWKRVDYIYGRSSSRAEFDAEMETFIKSRLYSGQRYSTFDLLRLASHCKDESFRQEEEWRLALPHTKNKPLLRDKVLYRGAQGDIPYIAHNLFHQRLPITQVMVGPFCEETLEIQKVLDNHEYEIPVTRSAIPLRRQP